MKIFIGVDHRGIHLKDQIINYVKDLGHEPIISTVPNSELDDYVEFAFDIATLVTKHKDSLGILLCSTGIGMSIAANKIKGAICARVVNKEEAKISREHNCANIIAFANNLSTEEMHGIIFNFINTKPGSLERYRNRTQKILDYEMSAYNEL